MKLINNPDTSIRTSFAGKLFRNRFRVPLSLFNKLCDIFKQRDWLQKAEVDCFGRPSVPFELKLLAALRFIGRGECFDTIQELTGDLVSAEVIRKFIIEWAEKMALLKPEYITVPNPDDNSEVTEATEMYNKLGFPGCIGSTDCVNIPLGCCPFSLKNIHTGKDGYPTLGFNCTVNHYRRFLHIAPGCPGSFNDIAKSRFDNFMNEIADGKYNAFRFKVRNSSGEWEELEGVYLIVDGGYKRWKFLQCPLKHSHLKKECLHSRWLESVRKDVECAFGILKIRFRCLKIPSRFHDPQVTDNIFCACTIIHNMLLDDALEQRESELSGSFREEEDLENWIQNPRKYRAESVRFLYRMVSKRSNDKTDMSSVGDNGINDVDSEDEGSEGGDVRETGWTTLHRKLVDHFFVEWKARRLQWTGCQEPVRKEKVISLFHEKRNF